MKILAVVLLLLGLLVSGHLMFRSLALEEGPAQSADVCSTVFGKGCDATLTDPFSKKLGIPLAGWGVIYFATLLLLLLLGRVLDEEFRAAATAAASLAALVGGVASAGLVVSLVAGVFPFCPLCAVANGLNLLALVPVIRFGGRPLGKQAGSWIAGARYLLGAKVADPVAARWRVLGFVFVAVVGAALYQWVLIEMERRGDTRKDFDPETVLAEFEATPVVEIPIRPDDPVLGPATAKAKLVVFSDAFCPFCQLFWKGIGRLTEPYGNDLQIVYKHFPLESMCNPSVKATLHPMACYAGLALEGAREQGQFWAYHDALFDPTVRARKDPFGTVARNLGLDADALVASMQTAATAARFDADIALGIKLGLTATPSIFLNGRKLRSHHPKAIALLIDHVLGRENDSSK